MKLTKSSNPSLAVDYQPILDYLPAILFFLFIILKRVFIHIKWRIPIKNSNISYFYKFRKRKIGGDFIFIFFFLKKGISFSKRFIL